MNRTRRSTLRPALVIPLVLGASVVLGACGLRERLEQRVSEEIAEKVLELASDDEVDVEVDDGKLTVKHKDGTLVHMDGEQGKVQVVDAEGTKTNYEGNDEEVRVTNDEGLDAVASKEIPKDFPLVMPPIDEVEMASRVVQPDGSKVYNVTYRSKSDEMAEEAARWQAEFEAKGLTVERTEMAGGGSQMITLTGKSETSSVEGSCIISTSGDRDRPGVVAIVTWSDPST